MSTKLSCRIPTDLTAWSDSNSELDQVYRFNAEEFSVELSFQITKRGEYKSESGETRYYGDVHALSMVLTPISSGRWDGVALVEAAKSPEGQRRLISKILKIGNRALRTFRVDGGAYGLKEFSFKSAPLESQLRRLEVTVRDDEKVIEPPKTVGFIDLLKDFESSPRPYFNTRRSKIVSEALEDGRAPEPETEFISNAVEFLENRNLRMAIIEGAIALEMAVARYLPVALRSRGIPDAKVRKFLSPELGLNKRVSVLLPLLDKLENVDVEKILALIRSRNEIVHESGYPEANVTPAIVNEQLSAVEDLIILLRNRRRNSELAPDRKAIVEAASSQMGVNRVAIEFLDSHRVFAEVTLSSTTKSDPLKIVEVISKAAAARDARFRENEHLVVKFGELLLPTTAVFYKGSLHVK